MISAICNIYIDSQTKLELLRETFPRVYQVSDNWLINVRGKNRQEAIDFITSIFTETKTNCILYKNLDEHNWARATSKMLQDSKHEYIYIFLEDHLLLKPVEHFQEVIRNMKECQIDFFMYSFYNVGLSVHSSEALYPDYSRHFYYLKVDQQKLEVLKKNNRHFYPFSLAGIYSKKYLTKVLSIENKRLIEVPKGIQILMENILFRYPKNRRFWFFVNRYAAKIGLRFVIYSPETPFNLEKSLFDCDAILLPIIVGGLRDELFANWDDDNISINSSLIKRGLYPSNLRYESQGEARPHDGKDFTLYAGESTSHQYCPNVPRVENIPLKYILVKKGRLRICSKKETFDLHEGQEIWVHANVLHTLSAIEDCVFRACIQNNKGND